MFFNLNSDTMLSATPGCVYGDTDPTACKALMQSELGTANCYNRVTQSQCCETCEELKDTSTPSKELNRN